MLTGKPLLDKLIELDGCPKEEVMVQCGYCENAGHGSISMVEDNFYKAVFEIASQYIEGVSNARKANPRKGLKPKRSMFAQPDPAESLFLKKLFGEELLSCIASVDPSFEPGPPWNKKIRIVLMCGYAMMDEDGEVGPSINEFHEAYLDAQDLESSQPEAGEEGRSKEEPEYEPPPFHIVSSSHSQQIIESDPDDEIGKAAIRLLSIAKAVQKGCKGDTSLVALQIEYSGGGDEGNIDAVEYLFSKGVSQDRDEDQAKGREMAYPPVKILFEGKTYRRSEYEELIKESAFSISYNTHGSWFNDYGGSGFLTVYLDRRVICGEHFQDDDPTDPSFDGNEVCPYYLWVKDV
jgi:hypothetical protein